MPVNDKDVVDEGFDNEEGLEVLEETKARLAKVKS